MRFLIFITFMLLFSHVDYGQGCMDKYRIHKSLKIMLSGEHDKAKEKFDKIKSEILDSDSTLFFKYQYLFESFDKYIGRHEKYPPLKNIDSLKIGLASINELIRQWDNGVDKKKMRKKYSLNKGSLQPIKFFFDSRIEVYNDSVQDYLNSLQRKRKADSLERENLRRLEEEAREREFQDSLYNEVKIEIPEAAVELANKVSRKSLIEKFGKNGETVQMDVSIKRDGVDKVYTFSLKYDEATFRPGSYKGEHTDYIISEMFEAIKVEISDFEIFMIIRGTADATRPKGKRYGGEFGDIKKRQTHVDGKVIDIAIKRNERLTNLEIAFLRAYNAEILFKEIVKQDINQLESIDYLTDKEIKKGDEYRTVSFILVINNYYEEAFNQLTPKNVERLKEIEENSEVKFGLGPDGTYYLK